MAIRDGIRDSLHQQLDNANAQKLLYEHRVTRLENRSQYLANGVRRKRVHHLCNRRRDSIPLSSSRRSAQTAVLRIHGRSFRSRRRTTAA